MILFSITSFSFYPPLYPHDGMLKVFRIRGFCAPLSIPQHECKLWGGTGFCTLFLFLFHGQWCWNYGKIFTLDLTTSVGFLTVPDNHFRQKNSHDSNGRILSFIENYYFFWQTLSSVDVHVSKINKHHWCKIRFYKKLIRIHYQIYLFSL